MPGEFTQEKVCFVVAPIGGEKSKIRQRSDRVLQVIDRALKDLGYTTVRSDQIAEPGMISHRMIQLLVEAPLVVADLTGANPNVYYELAIRHAVHKPVIQIIAKGEKIPFDIQDMRTLQIDSNRQYEAEDLIRKTAQEIEKPGFQVSTPISMALNRSGIMATSAK
jgi:hypothetical protein